jgi:hypothetical protein
MSSDKITNSFEKIEQFYKKQKLEAEARIKISEAFLIVIRYLDGEDPNLNLLRELERLLPDYRVRIVKRYTWRGRTFITVDTGFLAYSAVIYVDSGGKIRKDINITEIEFRLKEDKKKLDEANHFFAHIEKISKKFAKVLREFDEFYELTSGSGKHKALMTIYFIKDYIQETYNVINLSYKGVCSK